MKLQLRIKTSLVRNILVLVSSIIIGAIFNLPFGWPVVLDFITSMIICMLITMGLADMWYKVCKERWKLCWQYWVGLALVFASDWCFLFASKTVTLTAMFILLAITTMLGLGAGTWFFFVYKPEIEKRTKNSLEEYRKSLVDKGVPEDIAAAIVREAKEE